MKTYLPKSLAAAAILSFFNLNAAAETMAEYSAVPPLAVREAGPSNIMLTMSLDHQLFFEAYNDYTDLTGDGLPEITYTHSAKYEGYFNSDVCYDYSDGLFTPARSADSNRYCTSGGWSGNFLNWMSMTRMDMVRLVLYGGKRSVDTPTETILERAYLPQDAHSFAKYYNGEDIANLTDLDASDNGYTFCNTSQPSVDNSTPDAQKVATVSHQGGELTTPPLIRWVAGNYSLWASNERFQCLTREEMPLYYDDIRDPLSLGDIPDEYLGYAAFNGFGSNGNMQEVTGIAANSFAPSDSQVNDMIVKVAVCTGADTSDERCLNYNGNLKPYGVLQLNDQEFRNFGLLTGSYDSNKTYGVLRKNLAPLTTEIRDDGTFIKGSGAGSDDENQETPSIIGNLDAVRIVDYQFWYPGGLSTPDGRNFMGTYNGDTNCWWGQTEFNDGQCRNWGNPFSEILAESYRYFAKANGSLAVANDDGVLDGITADSWPTDSSSNELGSGIAAACSKNSVVAFNTSAVSYDDDELAGVTPGSIGIGGNESRTITQLTNEIGVREALLDDYFVGKMADVLDPEGDGLCTAKTVSMDLGQVRGTCPETPSLGGTYLGAGLAYYAHTNDINAATADEIETVQTYGVTLTPEVPTIRVMSGTREITIVPSCKNLGGGDEQKGNCALVDFRPLSVDASSGFYYVGWEDSEQGGDFDLDISGTIEYNVVGSNLNITTHIFYESAEDRLEFGFAVTGTGNPNSDGIYFPSGVSPDAPDESARQLVYDYVDSAGAGLSVDEQSDLDNFSQVDNDTITPECAGDTRCENVDPNSAGESRKQRYTLSLASTGQDQGVAGILEPPLYYAGKYGSFLKDNYETGDALPDSDSSVFYNNDGSLLGYEIATNPIALRDKLDKTISAAGTIPTVSTGTNTVSTTLTGEGIALQTFYYPQKNTEDGVLNWVGTLTALYIDKWGYLREDSNENGVLDAPDPTPGVTAENQTAGDLVVNITYDEDTGITTIERGQLVVDDASGEVVFASTQEALSLDDLDSLNYLWAVDIDCYTSEDGCAEDRPLDGNGNLRHIFTSIDTADNGARDGQIDGEDSNVAFTAANADDLAPLMDAGTADEAANLINYIRGVESEGFRSRTGGDKTYLLGDIINSAPAIVGRPNGDFVQDYSDASYQEYIDEYKDRKNMVYVGANDGMLHAFELGYYNAQTKGYYTDATYESLVSKDNLAKEKWAYVPYNLLPHLKWLAQPDYSHVYYMDGPVNVFDVNIFTPSTTHPGGWGTIIVAGMRFGGGEYTINEGTDAEQNFRSAYVIFDVTNPDAPVLLGEITDENLGYTTSNVDIIVRRNANSNSSSNDWHLVFGSGPKGPQGIREAVSNGNAYVYTLDLNQLANGTTSLQVLDTGVANSFVGGVTAKDWDGDYKTDGVYFGLVSDPDIAGAAVSNGQLMYATVGNANSPVGAGDIDVLLQGVDLPFSASPTAVSDSVGNRWVYAGSGRFYVSADAKPTNEQNTLFGVNAVAGPVGEADLLDVTNFEVSVTADGSDSVIDTTGGGTTAPSIGGTVDAIASALIYPQDQDNAYYGWKREYQAQGEKSYISPLYVNDTIFAATFNPATGDPCESEGRSFIYALDMFTGLPQVKRTAILEELGGSIAEGEQVTVEPIVAELAGALNATQQVSEQAILSSTSTQTEETDPSIGTAPAKRRSWREVLLEDGLPN